MSLFRAATGLAIGAGAGYLVALGLDPDMFVPHDQIANLVTGLADPTTGDALQHALGGHALLLDPSAHTAVPDGFHVFTSGDHQIAIDTQHPLPSLSGDFANFDEKAFTSYFGHISEPVKELMRTPAGQQAWHEMLVNASAGPEAAGVTEDLKKHLGEVAQKLGDTGFAQDLWKSNAAVIGGTSLGFGAIGAFQGNDLPKRPVYGQYSAAAAARSAPAAGAGAGYTAMLDRPSLRPEPEPGHTPGITPPATGTQHAAAAPQPASHLERYTAAMSERKPEHDAAPAATGRGV